MPAKKPPEETRHDAEKRLVVLRKDIKQLDEIAWNAANEERPAFGAAVAAKSKSTGLRSELARLERNLEVATITDPLERSRALLRQAQDAGSWQAVARLSAQLTELELELERERLRLAAEEMTSMDLDALIGVVEDSLDDLPKPSLLRLGRAVWRALGTDADKLTA